MTSLPAAVPRLAATLALIAALGGCTHQVGVLHAPRAAVAVATRAPNVSMIYLARTDGGVIAIDLGWVNAGRALRRGLGELGASAEEVSAVFLTHAHRDHIGAWRQVRHADFHMAEREVPHFLGRVRPRGLVPRLAERIRRTDRPRGGEVRIQPFARDTAYLFGPDTLRAFLLPGHTAGSVAYLFRGVLFVGDAVARLPWTGFRAAPSSFADDPGLAARSLVSLWERVAPFRVEYLCTAHAKCAAFTPALRARLAPPIPTGAGSGASGGGGGAGRGR